MNNALLLSLVIGLAFASGWAQTTATIVGTVTDSTGAVVPKVTITITSSDTGLARTTTTNQDGNYVATFLPVGHYSVTAEVTGFKKKTVTGIVLEVKDNRKIDVLLQVGDIATKVEVAAAAAAVETANATLKSVVEGKRIMELPLKATE